MYHLAFHFAFKYLPPKVQAVVISAISLPIAFLGVILIPGSIVGAVYVDETMIIILFMLDIPLLVVGGGLLALCALAMRPHGWRCLSGVLLILLGASTTLAFLLTPAHELPLTRLAHPLPPEAALLAEVLKVLCGPGIMLAGLALTVIQAKRGTRPAHLHDHEPPPA